MEIGDYIINCIVNRINFFYDYNFYRDTSEKKIGIVVRADVDLAKVLWSCGDQTWCMQEQLRAVKKCP
jgi:hypothetical protein